MIPARGVATCGGNGRGGPEIGAAPPDDRSPRRGRRTSYYLLVGSFTQRERLILEAEGGTCSVDRDQGEVPGEGVARRNRVHRAVHLHLGLVHAVLVEDVHQDDGLAPESGAGPAARTGRGRAGRGNTGAGGGGSAHRYGRAAAERVTAREHQDLLVLALALARRARSRGGRGDTGRRRRGDGLGRGLGALVAEKEE